MTIREKIVGIIEGKEKGNSLMRGSLLLASYGYRLGLKGAHFYADWIGKKKQMPLCTVSVGNIVCGGSGKTPLVAYLAKRFSEYGKVAILSRGYGRKSKEVLKVTPQMNVEKSGDEPLWLAQLLPEVDVIVGKDRMKAAHFAIAQRAEIAILDDGMQQRAIVKEKEIIAMHFSCLLGGEKYLPRGMLREEPERLKRADLIVISGIENEKQIGKCEEILKKYTKAPIVGMKIEVNNPERIVGKKIAVFCAIAYPKRFLITLARLGCTIVLEKMKEDHCFFSEKELGMFAQKAYEQGAECLVCTEKDQIKLQNISPFALPIVAVRISIVPVGGKEHLDRICDQVSHLLKERKRNESTL